MEKTEVKTPALRAAQAEPAILTANTYFWQPAGAANARRRNESAKLAIVGEFLKHLGGRIKMYDESLVWEKTHRGDKITVEFYYRESCTRVYKSLDVTVQKKDQETKNSNITSLRKLYKLYR